MPSELSFGPYAKAVDMNRTSVVFLCVDNDNHYIGGKVDPNVYAFMMETVDDLANTLMDPKEDPISGLFLWTALKDLPYQ